MLYAHPRRRKLFQERFRGPEQGVLVLHQPKLPTCFFPTCLAMCMCIPQNDLETRDSVVYRLAQVRLVPAWESCQPSQEQRGQEVAGTW